ncbi:MAG: class I SAM-dependent methyltransferase [Candidatus Eremiobacteraeota bacterium]|nr:class I SAM-dependent methyltransferase [Candidatus Eremiobacteraeota bacterium]
MPTMQTTEETTAAAAPQATPAPGPRSLAARKISALVERAVAESGISCAVRLASGEELRFGTGEPQFTVTFHSDKPLLGALTEIGLGEAYIRGEFDLDGDMYAMQEVRKLLNARAHAGVFLGFLWQLFVMPATWVNKRAIAKHYQLGDDFYLTFMDTKYRFYSQCLYHRDDETLEEAAEHKLESMWNGLQLKPGMRLLDIGGGWGGVHEYCGPRGVSVTSLTIAQDSFDYITRLDQRLGLDHCTVKLEDFLVHRPAETYDAVVIYGVIEHIPYYRRFAARLWDVLKPGGRFYLDASASIEKFDASDFTRRYIWPGSHAFLCLQDIVQELLYHGLDVVETKNETHDYDLTMRAWAERFDAHKDMIVAKWGTEIFRIWRLYLWTGAYGFHADELQAYHLVAVRRPDRGPRPSVLKRAVQFVRGLK